MSEVAPELHLIQTDGDAPSDSAGPYQSGAFARMFDLTGQVALVAGGGGLGRAMAAALADFGARLVIADLDLAAARQVARACARPRLPPTAAVALDITDPALVAATVAAVEAEMGRVDILVNAVGINVRKPALDYTPAEWRQILEINLSGVFYLTQAVARGMVARGYGRVLTIGSVSSLLGHPHHAPYAASKGGIALLTKVLANEWAPHGVTVNALGPTYTETALTAGLLAGEGARAELTSRIPLGRLGLPEDLAGATVFLCSPASGFVTGQTLYVDGGRTLD